ncbi:hypothetical protein CHH83_03385 [Bacillus sp. 7586-K]|nr:hypothetical protein CHH83_03385 [Bacillus sp. 7586-K]
MSLLHIHSYFITEIVGVRESLERTIGSVGMNNQIIASESTDENVKGFHKIMLKVNEVVSTRVSSILSRYSNLLVSASTFKHPL